MSKRIFGLGVAVLGLVLAMSGKTASAQAPGQMNGPIVFGGPIVFKNQSGTALTIEAISYKDSLGKEVALNANWKLSKGFFGYLLLEGDKKIPARQFTFRVRTAEGTSFWASDLTTLDEDGDFVVRFSSENYK